MALHDARLRGRPHRGSVANQCLCRSRLVLLVPVRQSGLPGPARLLGPDLIAFKAGIAGFWVETAGGTGEIGIEVSSRRLGSRCLTVQVR